MAALVAAAAFAQAPGTGIAANLQGQYAGIKGNLTAAAEAMPAGNYGYKPGTTPEARTYAQAIGHVANAQFGQCSGATGAANPNQGTNLEELTAKADLVKALADSFAVCDAAFDSLTDASALEVMSGGRGGPAARAVGLYGMIVHSNEMYGTIAAYLRANDIVPPSTANRGRGRGGRGGRGQ
jgi:hypothetical protein